MLPLLLISLALADAPVEVDGALVTSLAAPPLSVISPRPGTVYLLSADHQLQAWKADGTTWALAWSRPEPEAAGLFLAGGRPWIERHEVRAEPLEEGGSGPGAAGVAAVSAAPRSVPSGAVQRVDRGEALVGLGRKDGVKVGDEVRFLRTEQIASISGEGTTASEREVGTGTVRALEAERAMVVLGRGSRVVTGDIVEVRPNADRYPVAPERLGGLVEAGVVLRPLLALDTLGVAFVNDAWVNYAFDAPWYVEARLSPAGLGWSQDGNPLSMAAVAAGGLDNRWFSVGLGAGWSMLNQDVSIIGSTNEATDGGETGGNLQFDDVGGAFSLAQQARLGARDGLSVVVRNTFVLVPEYTYDYSGCLDYYDEAYDADCVTRKQTGSGFAFGGISMRGQVPTGERTDLFVDWGTGEAGATWVTGGVATWVRGRGDGGSVGLEVAAGYGAVTGSPNDETVSLRGPLVSAGVRWRATRNPAK